MRPLLALVVAAGILDAAAAGALELRVAARETVTVEYPGATAAFAVDPSTVEATVVGRQLVLVGRRAGQTLVTVVTPAAVETLRVVVAPAPPPAMALDAAAGDALGTWEGRYDSGTRRFTSDLTTTLRAGDRTARLRLYGIHESAGVAGRDVLAFPAASLALDLPGRSLVLLDELVEDSPLTLDGTLLRGLHLRQGGLTLHAGVASATPWEDLLLPGDGDRALGLSYRSDHGAFRLVPALLWLPDSDTELPGVASLGLEHGERSGPLHVRAEIGWSGEPGAALDLSFRSRRHQAWLEGETRPAAFAALGVAHPPGTFLDGAWSVRLDPRTTTDLVLSASRLDLAEHRQEAGSGRLEVRHQATDRWSLTAGLEGGGYRDRDAEASELRRGTASLGASYDRRDFGVAGRYRFQETSPGSGGGHGGRLTMRGARGAWRGHLFVDAQEQAPTLDLVLRDRPDLARALAALGFVAPSPEELVRLLRDNAPLLAEQGVMVGALDLDPLRIHGGLDLAWRGSGPSRSELGLRLVVDDADSVAGGRRAYLSTLSASRRLFADTDLLLSYTRWSTEYLGSLRDDRDSFEVAVRTGLDSVGLPGRGRRAISGRVVRDEGGTGEVTPYLPPLAGIQVVLDGRLRTTTDADGRFSFPAPGPGEHRVQVLLPPQPGAYFTAPSAVALPAGGEALFAISFSAARLAGTVRTDAGLPLAGVTLRLDGATTATATTDSSGAYRFAAPPGEVQVSVVPDSVPPGYDLGDLDPQVRHLAPGRPAVADFTTRAHRVARGVVVGGGSDPVTVTVLGTETTVAPDGERRFLLRGLPAGPVTLIVRSRRGETQRAIDVPAAPGSVTGIELAAP